MSKGKKVAIIGGDARQVEIAETLLAKGAEIFLIGFDRWDRNMAGMNKSSGDDVPWEELDGILMPVSGLKEGNKVEACFSSHEVEVKKSWVERSSKDCLIMTGIHTEPFEAFMNKWERRWIKLLERDDVAIYNSIPSAEGTLLMAIQETDITIHKSNTLLLGFGRTGQTIARTFSALGAYATVGTIHPSEKARAEAMGLETVDIDSIKDAVRTTDICINTIPALVITEDVLVEFPNHSVVIDLASHPGGTDFEFAKKRGIKALLAPGLPGTVAPKTAGRILAKVIDQLLREHEAGKEE